MKWRFIGAILGVTLLVLLILLIPMATYLRSTAYSQTMTELEKNAFALAARSGPVLWTPSDAATAYVDGIVRAYAQESGARVVVTDANGIVLVSSDADNTVIGTSFANRPEIASAMNGEVAAGERHSNTLADELLYVAVPALNGESVKGVVRITFPEIVVKQRLDAQISLLWIVGTSALLLAAIVAIILANSVTRPLLRLKHTAEAVADGDLEKRSDEHAGAPEIRALANAYNRMSDRLAELLEDQRRFSADASHQLRTPLTALRLRLETARDLIETDPIKASARIEAAELEAERLNDLVEALLLMSRGELDDGDVASVDLGEAVATTVSTWQPLAEERGVELAYLGPASLDVFALDGALEQIAGNLIDNALRVSKPGQRVDVTVSREGNRAVLHVLDRGPGLSDTEREHAFDRFWRADSTKAGGTGIGLAIVRRLVEASRGTVSLEPRDGGGIDAVAIFMATS